MQVYTTNDRVKRNKILDYFTEKKVEFCYTEQYSFFKTYDINTYNDVNLTLDNQIVYMFQWRNKKVKKEHLTAL